MERPEHCKESVSARHCACCAYHRSMEKKTFTSSLGKFSQETTLHGMKRAFATDSLFLRIAWMTLIVGMVGATAYQLSMKVQTYIKTPINFEISVNYEAEMSLPAVIICNSNLYRISEATHPRWEMYEVVREIYQDSNIQSIDPLQHPVLLQLQDGEQFIKASAHQLQDLLLSCIWPNGSHCEWTDFETIITDYGVCYGINTVKDQNRTAKVSNPGFGYGLRLLLNVEDYESMPGPQQTIGIKVLIYNQTDIPLVAEHGFDVAPGFQTSIGLNYELHSRLPKSAGGSCGSVPLHFFRNQTYSRKLCMIDHEYGRAANQCQCLAYSMPRDTPNQLPVCTASEYFGCMVQALQGSVHMSEKECPQQCVTMEYQQYISFSKLSPIKADSIIHDYNKKRDMEMNHALALEARHRHMEPYRSIDMEIAHDFLEVHDEIQTENIRPGDNMKQLVLKQLSNSSCATKNILPLIENRDFCNRDLLEQFQLDPAQVIPHLAPLFEELPSEVGNGIISCATMINSTLRNLESQREAVVHFMVEMRSFKGGREEEVRNWVRRELFMESVTAEHKRLIQDIRELDNFSILREEIENFLTRTEGIAAIRKARQVSDLLLGLDNTSNCISDLYTSLHNITDFLTFERIGLAVPMINESIGAGALCLLHVDNVTKEWKQYRRTVEKFKGRYDQLGEDITELCDDFAQSRRIVTELDEVEIDGASDFERTYDSVLDFIDGSSTKTEFMKELLSVLDDSHFLGGIRAHFQSLIDGLEEINDVLIKLGEDIDRMIKNFDYSHYGQMMAIFVPESILSAMNSTVPAVLSATGKCIPETSEQTIRFRERAQELLDAFLTKLDRVHNHLREFNESLSLSREFYRKNLVAVNVYLRDMSIEINTQEISYGFFSLLSDVGGTLGLFLGASILTIMEFAEYCCGRIISLCGKPLKKKNCTDSIKPKNRESSYEVAEGDANHDHSWNRRESEIPHDSCI